MAYAQVDIVELFGVNIRSVLNVWGIAHTYAIYGFDVVNKSATGDVFIIRLFLQTDGSSNVTVSTGFAVITGDS